MSAKTSEEEAACGPRPSRLVGLAEAVGCDGTHENCYGCAVINDAAPAPDAFCVSLPDGSCASTDPRDMHASPTPSTKSGCQCGRAGVEDALWRMAGTAMQWRVADWIRLAFTAAALTDRAERAARVVEEAIELAQADGLSPSSVYAILNRVYSLPVGNAEQEAGGIMVSLLAWAAGRDTSLAECALREIERVERPETIEKCRRKQAEKAKAGTARLYPSSSKRHRCMRCAGEFECQHPGCQAGYDVLPLGPDHGIGKCEPAPKVPEPCQRCSGRGTVTDYMTGSIRTDTLPPTMPCPECQPARETCPKGCGAVPPTPGLHHMSDCPLFERKFPGAEEKRRRCEPGHHDWVKFRVKSYETWRRVCVTCLARQDPA